MIGSIGNHVLRRLPAFVLLAGLVGCGQLEMTPPNPEQRTFTQESAVNYKEAYRIIAKQMRACFRVIGDLGNGYDVQADLDGAEKKGSVELYIVGLTGAGKPEDSRWSRIITIEEKGAGSFITTTGTTPGVVYRTHVSIPLWLAGVDSCVPTK